VCRVVIDKNKRPTLRAQMACGVVAAPLFITAFTAIGAKRPGYDWRRHMASSLATGDRGWQQRPNFGLPECSFSLPLEVLAAVPAEAWAHEWSQHWLRLPASV
jgi:hypothetical protein